jgi:DNA modification methylase
MSGILYCGDNLEVLAEYIPPESVDLIYLDPPFNSQRTYNIVYKGSAAQTEAFKDYWSWADAAQDYARLVESAATPRKLRPMLQSLHELLIDDDADLLAYITMMAARLVALHKVLKPTGSLYLHCDPTASHYLKVTLDAIFGSDRLLNEVIWQRTSAHNDPSRYGRVHDVLLFYTKSEKRVWNQQFDPPDEAYFGAHDFEKDADGRLYRKRDLTAPAHGDSASGQYTWNGKRPPAGRMWSYTRENMERLEAEGRIAYTRTGTPRLKIYLENLNGVPYQDVWARPDLWLNSASAERLGYPTQKPIALMNRIIKTSSNAGDLVLDPFCGCGTTIEASERLGRRWIGIDIARKAIEVIEGRFDKTGLRAPEVQWHPKDVDAARALAQRDKRQFEEWALRKVRATRRRKKDRGIDGESTFRDGDGRSRHVLVSVKGGSMNPAMVRDLRGTLERERADIGVLVSMLTPSKEMRFEATRAGHLSVSDGEGPIPRLQLVTVEQIFDGKVPIRCPGQNVTEMPRGVPAGRGEQLELGLDNRVKSSPRLKAATPGPAKASPKPKVDADRRTASSRHK